ncbi:MAG: molybdopterin molybdotransferase MoeA [Cyanosarcina radialis HA8281-LM2]|jgi:molybdopterin molybdotransferase|nr:molybdopterin molybdotransferase MoeA [Cyanosarcina radialis HA8281-LM2]
MLSVKQAEEIILGLVPTLDVETVDLSSAAGRILAAPVTSELDFPHWDNSAMDGYAVRFADVQNCSETQPAVLSVIEEIPAGDRPQLTVQAGQAARIFTGACMPAGADTVVMQEQTRKEADRIAILAAPSSLGDFVRHRGSFYQAGTTLLPAGIALNAAEIAVLAALQCQQLSVYRRPRVAIFSTGDELVTPDRVLQPGQIVDSNNYALSVFVTQMGAIPISLGIVRDRPEELKTAIERAVTSADVVLSSGGVSVGDYDYVEQILAELEAKIHIRSVAVKPGKPLTVATFEGERERGGEGELLIPNSELRWRGLRSAHTPNSTLYFGLPGNPVSALVSCWRFVQPALRKLSGLADGWEPTFVRARSLQDLRSDGKRETYLWGKLRLVDGEFEFELAGGSHSSGNLINLAQTNGMAVLPVGQTSIAAGEPVRVLAIK